MLTASYRFAAMLEDDMTKLNGCPHLLALLDTNKYEFGAEETLSYCDN